MRVTTPWLALSACTLLVLVVTAFEAIGWPVLAEPIQRWLSESLERRVSFAVDGHTLASVRVRLLGRLRIEAPQMRIAAPAWSTAPDMLHARDVVLTIAYADLWRAHRGHPLRIHALQAAELDASFERLQDGRASWLFGRFVRPDAGALFELSLFDRLQADAGTLRYRDEPARLELAARLQPQGAGVQLAVQG